MYYHKYANLLPFLIQGTDKASAPLSKKKLPHRCKCPVRHGLGLKRYSTIEHKSREPYKNERTPNKPNNPKPQTGTRPQSSISRSLGMGLVASATASCSGGLFSRRSSPPPPQQTTSPTASDNNRSQPPPTKVPDPEIVRVFCLLDADGDGRISAAEMRKANRCTDETVEEMVAAADLDGDGFISLDEFLAVMEGGDESSDARAAFDEFDANKDGVITAEEVRHVLRRLGIGGDDLTIECCQEMVAAYDANGDGVLSFDEFKEMMATKLA
jgi:calcium-binding protein CML